MGRGGAGAGGYQGHRIKEEIPVKPPLQQRSGGKLRVFLYSQPNLGSLKSIKGLKGSLPLIVRLNN